jgi:lysophospholipase L1-like esterase
MRLTSLIVAGLLATGLVGCQTAPTDSPLNSSTIPAGTRSSDSTKPARHIDEASDWVQRRYRAIGSDLAQGIDLAAVQVLFVGDSITQFYAGEDDPAQAGAWQSAYTARGSPNFALNLGVAGDRTENVLYRLLPKTEGGMGHLDDPRIEPQIIVLMIGINNTWSNRSDIVEMTVDGQLAVIRRLRALRPQASLIVNALLPTNNRPHDRELVEPINGRLATEVARMGPSVTWLDTYPAFLRNDGSGDPTLFKDGVHPNAAGYARWSSLLLPKLDAVRATRSSWATPKANP